MARGNAKTIAILAVPGYRRQFFALFRRSPGAVVAINGANELINLGGGLGVRFAYLSAPVALVSAISSTSTLFVFGIGILLTLFLPGLGREDREGDGHRKRGPCRRRLRRLENRRRPG